MKMLIIIAICLFLVLLPAVISHLNSQKKGVVAGPGLGHHGDYATFDKDGNFTGIDLKAK